jgi:hypothetical protein
MVKITQFCLVIIACAIISGCGSNLEDSSVPIVNDILQRELGNDAAECLSVELGEEFAPYRYRAKAVMDNGRLLDIVVHDLGDTVEVTIPYDE